MKNHLKKPGNIRLNSKHAALVCNIEVNTSVVPILTFFFIIGIISFPNLLNGQSLSRAVLGVGGGTFNISKTHINWTVGEAISGLHKSSDELLTIKSGFQQPNKILIRSKMSSVQPQVVIAPNPVSSILNMEIPTDLSDLQLNYQLIDAHGKVLIEPQQISVESTSLDLTNYPAGLYFLQLIGNQSSYNQSFKVIKLDH